MIRIVVLLAVLFVGWYFLRWFVEGYKKHGRPFAVKATLVAMALLLIVLAATGRAHWLGAVLASALAGLRFLLPLLLKSLPFLAQYQKTRASEQGQQGSSSTPANTDMSEQEAREVLGVDERATREDIVEAHRRLIQKLHPDRGGNDYLASRINQAKDVLLKKYS